MFLQSTFLLRCVVDLKGPVSYKKVSLYDFTSTNDAISIARSFWLTCRIVDGRCSLLPTALAVKDCEASMVCDEQPVVNSI